MVNPKPAADGQRTRAAIYLRQSVDKLEGIERQRKRCMALATSRDWDVVETFEDNDVSATKPRGEGTAWARLIEGAEAGDFDVVVAVNLDRLARQVSDVLALSNVGLGIATLEGDIDTTTAEGQFRSQLLASLAAFETNRKQERAARAIADRVAQGRPVATRRRYGYETDGNTPRQAEAEVVRWAFDYVAKGGTIGGLRTEFIARNVPVTTGNAWHRSRIRGMLTNPHYAGIARYKGEETDSPSITPIVDRDVFEEVRSRLTDASRRTTPGRQPRHLLSGIVRCNLCGARMSFSGRSYRCSAYAGEHAIVSATNLDARALDEVALALLTTPRQAFEALEGGASIGALNAALQRNAELERETLADRRAGRLSTAVAREELEALRAERDTIEDELKRAHAEKGTALTLVELVDTLLDGQGVIDLREFMALRDPVKERIEALPLPRRRDLVRALLDIEVGRPSGTSRADGLKRVYVWHLVATHLNPDAPDVGPDEGNSSGPGDPAKRRAPRAERLPEPPTVIVEYDEHGLAVAGHYLDADGQRVEVDARWLPQPMVQALPSVGE